MPRPFRVQAANALLSLRAPVLLFIAIFSIRVAGIGLATATGFHPFAGGQVDGHARQAEIIANGFVAGELALERWDSTFERWGLLLSVFWLLPGPSLLYAQLAMAAIGAAGIYNVYVIARHYHSHRAGLIAIAPLAVFPSYVFMHGVLQREALVLFSLTAAYRLLFVRGDLLQPLARYTLAAVFLLIPAYLRTFNAPVLGVVAVVGVLAAVWHVDRLSRELKLAGTALSALVGIPLVAAVARYTVANPADVVQYLADVRLRRARGRAVYLPDVAPTNLIELVGFSWIAALYFLFSPFPWMVETTSDFVIMLESLVTVGFAVLALRGFKILAARHPIGAIVLLSWLLVYAVLFGLGTANFGTGLRHRQAAVWVIYLVGAVGVARTIEHRGVT